MPYFVRKTLMRTIKTAKQEIIMKKLATLIAIMLMVTIGGVYASWTYLNNTDVADQKKDKTMNLTGIVYSSSFGAYELNTDTLLMKVDPLDRTSHDTGLVVEGEIVITFTPNVYAPEEVKTNGITTTWQLALSDPNRTFNDGEVEDVIMSINHPDEKHSVVWTPNGDGTFSCTIKAAEFASHLSLTAFTLDTETLYHAYETALSGYDISIIVSDGQTPGSN
jgi:hypothetical protein